MVFQRHGFSSCSVSSPRRFIQFIIFHSLTKLSRRFLTAKELLAELDLFPLDGLVDNLPSNTPHFFLFYIRLAHFFSIFQPSAFDCASLRLCQTVSSPASTKWLWLHQTVPQCSYFFGTGLIFPGSTELCVCFCLSLSLFPSSTPTPVACPTSFVAKCVYFCACLSA